MCQQRPCGILESILVVTQFNGVVTNNLEQWGFQVVARTPTPNGDSEPLP
ncbi:MAG: hypothetical protein IPL78_25570 [Chloroflexi bacterium]|nr:hypothetical protein [Chloroflexota bacterium]